ncbi:MAG: hypothetical protein QXW45_06870 [Thermosphaera sp.]
MRSVSVMLSAVIASTIMLFAVLALYVPLLSRLGGVRATSVSMVISDVIYERPMWDASSLAERLREATGARYVKVNITAYNPLDNVIVFRDYYEYKPLETGELEGLHKIFSVYVISTSDLLILRYEVEVGV